MSPPPFYFIRPIQVHIHDKYLCLNVLFSSLSSKGISHPGTNFSPLFLSSSFFHAPPSNDTASPSPFSHSSTSSHYSLLTAVHLSSFIHRAPLNMQLVTCTFSLSRSQLFSAEFNRRLTRDGHWSSSGHLFTVYLQIATFACTLPSLAFTRHSLIKPSHAESHLSCNCKCSCSSGVIGTFIDSSVGFEWQFGPCCLCSDFPDKNRNA